ncbi:replication protein P [Oceanicoccus sp. KOV_DT_Chl]|uniref:replication protein P n=1 Tax=Oceanicoccus sp. KOV_DT_Chl TaxID=1904639 RepID=UPI001EEF5392|nr:replication protein P [Oceanicoccus sp. KOV_DT_Chl]
MASEIKPASLNEADKRNIFTAIGQIFAEFELVYHNQYHKAFPTEEKLSFAKKIWYNNLNHLTPDQIIAAAHQAIRQSEFLPTIKGLLKYVGSSQGLPDAYSAYIEACQAASPKIEQQWSHPAVYMAGVAADWFFLASNAEAKAFPVFKRHYEILCERVIGGEVLAMPSYQALPETISQPLSNQERKQRMKKLRANLNL